MDGNMIQGLLIINWFRLDVKEGDQIPNIKVCCEYDIDRMLKEIMKSWCGISFNDSTVNGKIENGTA